MPIERSPESSHLGLVSPPESVSFISFGPHKSQRNRPDSTDMHHLYWPKRLYADHSDLALEFRSHRFNVVWLLESEHAAIHDEYDGVPVPYDEVMHEFLREAVLLDFLDTTVNGLVLLDASMNEGKVKNPKIAAETRKRKIDTIQKTVVEVYEPWIVTHNVATLALDKALEFATAA